MFRFRRFSIRLLVLIVGLLFAALATTYFLLSRANEENAKAHAASNLEMAAGLFDETVRQRIAFLAGSAEVMTGDYAIRDLFLRDDAPDRATLASILLSYTQRVGASFIAMFDVDGALLAASDSTMAEEQLAPYYTLVNAADEKDMPVASGFAHFRRELQVLVVVPLYAPYPNIFAWFGLAFPLDQKFAGQLKATSRVEATFVTTADPARPGVFATTLPGPAIPTVARAAAAQLRMSKRLEILELPDDRYVTLFKLQELLGGEAVMVALQRPLGPELAAARDLENYLVVVSLAALALATLAAVWIARGVSQPLLQLAAHTKLVAAGDYETPVQLTRADELGQLATAFNEMTVGLAERDRVRDLLNKNVSPEIAAQLLRDGAALGGEERDVTILFSDLRGFTTMSEKLPPRDLLALLNRYLDRMSAEIERHGGVIDKYIGDAIMALFGAPLTQPDAADRALGTVLVKGRAEPVEIFAVDAGAPPATG